MRIFEVPVDASKGGDSALNHSNEGLGIDNQRVELSKVRYFENKIIKIIAGIKISLSVISLCLSWYL